MRKVFFTEIRLWLVQIGIPAALIYLYIVRKRKSRFFTNK